jgi:hypothetical protein
MMEKFLPDDGDGNGACEGREENDYVHTTGMKRYANGQLPSV